MAKPDSTIYKLEKANNNIKKIQTFSVRTRSFIHLNDLYVLNGLYANDTSQEAITPYQAFC